MKKLILSIILIYGFESFAQFPLNEVQQLELGFEVHGKYNRPVKKEWLKGANFLDDLISAYPKSWISSYESVEIKTTCNKKVKSAFSKDDVLSLEQKENLKNVDLASEVAITIVYNYVDPLTKKSTKNKINVVYNVVPEVEAEFPGGMLQMTKYLKENCVNKIPVLVQKNISRSGVRFTVNENGEVDDVKIFKSSGDVKVDALLLETVNRMPKWNSAKDGNGKNVKQEFVFNIGKEGC